MITGQKVTKTVAGAGVIQVLGPNSRRVGVIIPAVSTGGAYLAFGDTPAQDDGFRIQSGAMTPFLLLFQSPNDYITQPLNVYLTGAATLSVVELIDRLP